MCTIPQSLYRLKVDRSTLQRQKGLSYLIVQLIKLEHLVCLRHTDIRVGTISIQVAVLDAHRINECIKLYLYCRSPPNN